MSIILVCPACGTAASLHRPPPPDSCLRCAQPYPPAALRTVASALGAEQSPRPLLLTLGIFGTLFSGSLFLLSLLMAPFDLGSYTINDVAVSGPEFLRRAGAIFGTLGVLMLAIGYALARDRTWSRPLMMAYWLGGVVLWPLMALGGGGSIADGVAGAVFSLCSAAVAGWYLYRKPNVLAYYARLEADAGSSG